MDEINHIGQLKSDPNNARKHNQRNIGQIVSSLQEVGGARSIVIDEDNIILAGNGVIEAAGIAGIENVRVIEADGNEIIAVKRKGLTPEQKTRLALWDNRAAELAEWDVDQLQIEFDAGMLEGLFSDIDLDKLGLETKGEPQEDVEPQIDKAEELRVKWGVELGQLWQLGEHRLICGDCTDKAVVARVMGGEKANLCLTDPPYGLGDGKASGKNDYDQHEDSRENLEKLAAAWLPIARDVAPAVVFSPGVTNAWIYPEADWMMCWFYGGGQLRSSWGFNCWQPFLCYGKDPSLASGNGGRPDAVDMNVPASAGDIDHPCPKPLKLWEWFIGRLSFGQNDVLYDPFSGSGTTLIACERLNRKCRAVEISPAYVAVAIQRWVDVTGQEPVLLDT